MTHLRLPAVVLALSIASTAWADLRTYDVPPQDQQEIYNALVQILNPDGPDLGAYGKVQVLASGQLVVNAPPKTLDQVELVLQAIRARPVAAAPRVELQYWAVVGSRPAAANAAGTAQPRAQVDVTLLSRGNPGTPPPSALNEVLAEIKRVHGDLQFRVLGTTSLTTQSGQHGEIGGSPLRVEQTTFVQGDTLNARIEMLLSSTTQNGPPPNRIEVGTSLRRGEFVVLGQSELVGGGFDGPVFFIVHWPLK
jgi:hypothetical protein